MTTQKAGVIIDNWKLPIFRQHLEGKNYEYEVHSGLTPDTRLITVQVAPSEMVSLAAVLKAAMVECANDARGKV